MTRIPSHSSLATTSENSSPTASSCSWLETGGPRFTPSSAEKLQLQVETEREHMGNTFFFTKITITGFDLKSYRQCLQKWNAAISAMNEECKSLGSKNCLPVIYEQLVLHPEQWMRKILNFLEVPWNDRVLHHEAEINKKDGISLSKVERSSDQVM